MWNWTTLQHDQHHTELSLKACRCQIWISAVAAVWFWKSVLSLRGAESLLHFIFIFCTQLCLILYSLLLLLTSSCGASVGWMFCTVLTHFAVWWSRMCQPDQTDILVVCKQSFKVFWWYNFCYKENISSCYRLNVSVPVCCSSFFSVRPSVNTLWVCHFIL